MKYPNLECLYLVIQVRTTDLNKNVGLPPVFVTQDSKPTSTLKPFLSHIAANIKKIIYHCLETSPTLPDLCHMGALNNIIIFFLLFFLIYF
jgi:hypothetical protein